MLILAYHRVNPEVRDGLSVSPATLADELNHLVREGWRNVILDEELDKPHRVEAERTFAITFDDGYQDNYLHAAPVLEDLGMRATIYLVSSFIDSSTPFPWVEPYGPSGAYDAEDLHMTSEQLERAASRGVFTYGSHTRTHPFLSRLSREQAADEIEGSKDDLERRLGIEIKTFCYPAGDFNDQTVQLVAAAGYRAAVVTPNRAIAEGPYTLHRVGIYSHITPRLFRLKTHPLIRRAQKAPASWKLRRAMGRARRIARKRG